MKRVADERTGHMSEVVLEIKIPEDLLRYGYSEADIQQNIREWLVISLFIEHRISSGKAARLLGISRVEFLDLLRKRGIAFLDYSPSELAEEFETVERLSV